MQDKKQALEELSDLLQLQVMLQVTLHKIDSMSSKRYFQQSFKMKTNNFYTFIEKKVEAMTKDMNLAQGEVYNAMTKEVEDLVNTINVVVED